MNRISREELIERRKKKLQEKELENDIMRDMRITFQRLRLEELLGETESPYAAAAIRFSLTLFVLYGFFIVFYLSYISLVIVWSMLDNTIPAWLNTTMSVLDPFFHASIWFASFYSVYRKKSVIDDLINFFV